MDSLGLEVGFIGSRCYVRDISRVVKVWTRLANGGGPVMVLGQVEGRNEGGFGGGWVS
jgi:hypothetical protein